MKKMYEIEIEGGYRTPTYLYIETDDDIEIDITGSSNIVTHITTIENDMGLDPDLIIRRRIDE